MAKNNYAGSGVVQLNDDNYFSPFDKPIKKEIQERLDEEHRETAPRVEPVEETVLKSVYCNYRGRLTVYDIHGQKVQDLSGMITYEKYTEIERRSDPNITEFDGIEDYRRIGAELKKSVKESDSIFFKGDKDLPINGEPEPDNDDPFSQVSQAVSYGAPQPNQNPPPGAACSPPGAACSSVLSILSSGTFSSL